MFTSRRAAAATSVVTAAMATGGIMLACGYYRDVQQLPIQLASIGIPIALPFLIASLAAARRRSIWWIAAGIQAIGWAWVIYAETRPDMGGGPSLAIVIGWFAGFVALIAALILTAIMEFRR